MDGNRRWAKEQGLTSLEGHKKGYEKMRQVIKWVKEAGIDEVIFFALSTENWNRAEEEIAYLLNLFRHALSNEFDSLKRNEVKVKIIGDRTRFPKDIEEMMSKVEADTANFKTTVVLAMSYGGRDEILNAVRKIAQEKTNEEILGMTEQDFSNYLYTEGISDPDMIIRPGGEKRLSGFLTWQSVYSELFFLDTYWPAFSKEEFLNILEEFSIRQRRHGK